jgi:hypothetical protein
MFKKDFSPVEFSDEMIDKFTGGKKNTAGLSVYNTEEDIGNIYLRKNIPLNDVESIAIHELGHDVTRGEFPLEAISKYHRNPMSIEQQKFNNMLDPEIVNTHNKHFNYVVKPTESYARLMQARRFFGLKPGQQIGENEAGTMLKIAGTSPHSKLDKT